MMRNMEDKYWIRMSIAFCTRSDFNVWQKGSTGKKSKELR